MLFIRAESDEDRVEPNVREGGGIPAREVTKLSALLGGGALG